MATTIYRIGQDLLTSSSLRITRGERSIVYGDARNNSITISVSNPIGDEGDFIDGGAGNDTITAANTNDEIYGGDGADFVRANGGNDLVDGGSGNDTLDGGDGDDVVSGGTGNDVVKGGRGNDTLHGDDGDDIVDGGDGNDVMTGGLGVDTMLGGFGDDSADGGDGNDTVVGSFGNDTLSGGLGNDLLDGGSDNDTLDGGDGDDNLLGGSGNDVLRGGAGADFLSAADGNDLLEGGDGNDDLNAGSGDDIVHGGSGNDLAAGMAGNDTVNGDAGNDTLLGGDGADTLNGGDGDDMLVSGRPQFDPVTGQLVAFDSLDGGAGNDTADLSGYSAIDTRLLTLLNIETIITGAGNDVIIGDDLANTLNSGAGDDTIDGRGGDDILIGGAGADLLIGNGGFDTVDLSASPASDPLTGAGVTITLNGTALDPTIAGTGAGGDAEGDQYILVERFIGSAFADIFNGDELANTFVGGAGADVLNGGLGSDTAEYATSATAVNVDLRIAGPQVGAGGDAEGDTLTGMENLIGSALNDTLTGDGGLNRLDGGAGDDTLRAMGGGGASASEFDRLIGGTGFDTADYSLATGPIRIGAINAGAQLAELNAAGTAVLTVIELDVERIVGSGFADIMSGGATVLVNNIFDGGAGNDVLSGGGGDDLLVGGAGGDQLQGGTGSDTVDYSASDAGVQVSVSDIATSFRAGVGGHAQGDLILGDIENFVGSAFDDVLLGNLNANVIRGGDGNDRIRGGAGADILDGGNGDDLLDYSTSAAGVSVNLTTNAVSGGDATGDVISNFDSVLGGGGNDVVGGSAAANTLLGGGGNDVLVGGSGDDVLVGGAGADTMDGGANIDTADYSSSALGITLVAATSGTPPQPIAFIGQTTGGVSTDATGDILINVENIVGSAFNDSIAGNGLANNLQGGAGIDTLSYAASTAGVSVSLTSTGTSTGSGGYAAGDVIAAFENLVGSGFADVLNGSSGANTIRSGASNFAGEVLRGGGAADILVASGTTAAGAPRSLFGGGTTPDGGADGVDTFNILDGFNIIQDWQANEQIILDQATVARTVIGSSGNFYFRLDTDATAGNGGATTETWVLLGSQATMTPTQAVALANQINAFVIVDPLFIA
jgi:Ca2+-binding RTX toxin-like protein